MPQRLLAIWDDVVSRKMSITGACGALYDGASPDGSKDQTTISRVHQERVNISAFGITACGWRQVVHARRNFHRVASPAA